MTLKKLLLTIAGGLAILGAFLPWYKASIFGYTATSNAFQMGALYVILALIAILCAAAMLAVNLLKKEQINKVIKLKDFSKVTLISGIALVAIAVIAFIAIKSESSGFGSISWGIWFIGIGGICTIVLPYLKNIPALDKVVIGEATKSSKSESKSESKTEKSEKSETKKPEAKKSETKKPETKKSEKSSK